VIIKKLINLFINKNKLCYTPNQHAPKPSIKISANEIYVNGYQEYIITKNSIKPSSSSYDLTKKTDLLSKYYKGEFIKGKTFLDLGSASGYFTFMAILNDCKNATAIDIDKEHLKIMETIKKEYNINNINIISENIDNYDGSADIVNALSIIHWIFSCTSILGSMNNMISLLRNMTKEVLFIEWIDTSDEAIKYFKHLDYNKKNTDQSYNYENFIFELNKQFSSVEMIGETRNTRKLFKANT
tara:strand:+ start:767 stop:1492 length:726 start_codon:yes stop_codon:yes gene_type:complete